MQPHGTHRTYIAGFILSVLFTLGAYQLVTTHTSSGHQALSHPAILTGVVALGLAQLVVQLVLFLHLGREPKPRWNLWTFAFMLLVLVILVGGSLWIMNNLDYNMTGHDVEEFIIKDEGIKVEGHQH